MIKLENIRFRYQEKEILKGISLSIAKKEIFGFLGPNGSGKTTLFRLLSTILKPSRGRIEMDSLSFPGQEAAMRKSIGVVFQSPSLDGKLTVRENLLHQGHLYGQFGSFLATRCEEMLKRLGMREHVQARVETLSGGQKRRVELAKALLHKPKVLILDEPSTGLDPGARIDLWKYLKRLRDEEDVTVLMTTHLMEEAEHCDRLAVLSHGQVLSEGAPEVLKRKISGDVIVIEAQHPEILSKKIQDKFHVQVITFESFLQIEHEKGAEFMVPLAGAFAGEIKSVTVRKPTLEDVFIHETGHRFWDEDEEKPAYD